MPSKILHHALPEGLDVLAALRVSAVSLANNHTSDYGVEAFQDTITELDRLGIGYFGAGHDLAEASAPWVCDTENGRVAAIGFSWTTQWVQDVSAATATSPGVNPIEQRHIVESVHRVRDHHSPDLLVVSLHWGEGMSKYPRPDQVGLAREIIETGADIVMGHHPHCLQPMERYGRGAIFCSLGNALASPSRRTPDNRLTYGEGRLRPRPLRQRLTAIASVDATPAGSLDIDYLPVVQRSSEPVLRSPDSREEAMIRRALVGNAAILRRRWYRQRYAVVRRVDEIRSKAEEIREFGLKDLSWKTPFRMVRRLVTGRNMH